MDGAQRISRKFVLFIRKLVFLIPLRIQVQLPDIFAEAYPDEPKAREIPVTMWGVTLDPLNPKKDPRISVVLMKFLRARLA